MREVYALILVLWVFIGGPALCLASVKDDGCACEESTCPDCESHPCRGSHDCHSDPCPAAVTRPEREHIAVHPVHLDRTPAQSPAAMPISPHVTAISREADGPMVADGSAIPPRAERSALLGSPLLI